MVTLALAASVGLRLEEVGELSMEEGMALTRALANTIEKSTGQKVAIDDPLWSSCQRKDRCIEEIKARTRSDEVIFIKIFAGVTMLRVQVNRIGPQGAQEAALDVPNDAQTWSAPLRKLTLKLFPQARAQPDKPMKTLKKTTTDPPPEKTSIVPWVVLGVSAAVAGIGVGFGVSSRSARNDSQDPTLPDPRFDLLADRAQTHGIAANVLFISAALGAVTSVVLYLLD